MRLRRTKLRAECTAWPSLHPQAIDGNATDQMLFDDLAYVFHFDAAVPDLLRIDDDGDAARALIEAAGGVARIRPLTPRSCSWRLNSSRTASLPFSAQLPLGLPGRAGSRR